VVALLAGLAMGDHPGGLAGLAGDRLADGRLASWRAGLTGRWVAAVAAALVIAQMAVLVNGFRPARAIPTNADRAVGLRLESGMRALGGTVAVPSDPGLGMLVGLPAGGSCAAAVRALNGATAAQHRHPAGQEVERDGR
jgi:hypothetical protein